MKRIISVIMVTLAVSIFMVAMVSLCYAADQIKPLQQIQPTQQIDPNIKQMQQKVGGIGRQLAPLPDLFPDNPQPNLREFGFCNIQNGKLIVSVRNQGKGDAAETLLQIKNVRKTFTVPTPPVPKGTAVNAAVDPAFCIDRPAEYRCYFTMVANYDNSIPESDTHNTAFGICNLPDLVIINPQPELGVLGYCNRQNGMLVVRVKNQGIGDAPASNMQISCSGKTWTVPTPPIPGGKDVDVVAGDLSGCSSSGDYDVTIIINYDNSVVLDPKENNKAVGHCMG